MPRPRSERRSIWPAVVLAIGLLPALYVLSVGPAAWLTVETPYMKMESYKAFYGPLERLAGKSLMVHRALKGYRRLFVADWKWNWAVYGWASDGLDLWAQPAPP